MEAYLGELLRYNIIDNRIENIVSAALSEKSLSKVQKLDRDSVRADMFKNILVNLI